MTFHLFGGSALRKQLFTNTLSQLIGRAISALATLGITILVARRLGADGYGDFVKITTYVVFFYLLADFGYNAIFLRDEIHWQDLLGLRLVTGSLLVCAALAILFIIPQGITQGYTQIVRLGILFFVPTILFQALTTSANALFQKHLRYDASAVAVAAGSIVSLIFVWKFTSMLSAITALLIGSGITALVGLALSKPFIKTFKISLSFTRIRSLFIASFPLGLTLLFNLLYFHIDSIILTFTRTSAEVGIYGLAYKVFELPLVVPTFFMNALYPVMLKYQRSELKIIIKKSCLFLFSTSLLFTFVLWFSAPLLVYIKTDFSSAIPALRILSLSLPFFFLSSLTMWTLIARRKQQALMYIYGGSMVLNILFNVLYIPQYGYMAAAWITVVSEALVLLVSGVVILL